MQKFFKGLFGFVLATLCLCMVACKKIESPRTELVFGTVCTVNAFNDGTSELYNKLFEKLHELDNKFSTTIPTSEIEETDKEKVSENTKIYLIMN